MHKIFDYCSKNFFLYKFSHLQNFKLKLVFLKKDKTQFDKNLLGFLFFSRFSFYQVIKHKYIFPQLTLKIFYNHLLKKNNKYIFHLFLRFQLHQLKKLEYLFLRNHLKINFFQKN